jgi:hypothetical protein
MNDVGPSKYFRWRDLIVVGIVAALVWGLVGAVIYGLYGLWRLIP